MKANYFFSGVINRGTRNESEFFGTLSSPAIENHDGFEDVLDAIIKQMAAQQPHLKPRHDNVVLRVLIPIWASDDEDDTITFFGLNDPRPEETL